jgi:tetratricopeptide (TPR) repeat protein
MKRLIVFCMFGLLALIPSARAATLEEAIDFVHQQLAAIKIQAPDKETPSAHAVTMDEAITDLKQQWAVIKYQTPDKRQQHNDIAALAEQAAQVSEDNPGKADPLVWQAIILGTKADVNGGLGGLGDDEKARDLLLQAEKIDPQALNGSIYTLLGSLYYKVPGWPIGFGDDDQAKQYFEKALAINPDGIEPNFFYGEFLYETGDYDKAKSTLEHGLNARLRSGAGLADKGRREETQELLQKVNQKLL